MIRHAFVFVGPLFLLLASGCTALEQFPKTAGDYGAAADGESGASAKGSYDAALIQLDPDYAAALNKIKDAKSDPEEQKRIRNREIDKRIAVIDANFKNFQIALAQENVTADFGVSLVEVGVGGVGALVAETASQILSAVSGGLAGARAAYNKATLYEKALSALLAQMIAGRKVVLARIYEGRTRSIDEYPLSAAAHDLDAYYFAGSLPGAIVATSADAKAKSDAAEEKILKILANQEFGPGESSAKLEAYLGWDGTQYSNAENVRNLNAWKQLNGISVVSNTSFLIAKEWQSLRAKAVQDLKIP